MFLARFEPKIGRFGPWRIPKCLENGPLWDKNKRNFESLSVPRDESSLLCFAVCVLRSLCPLLLVIGLGVEVYS